MTARSAECLAWESVTVLDVDPAMVRVLSCAGDVIGRLDPRLVQAALDWIDEPVGLYDDRPVRVADLWHAVVVRAVGSCCERLMVVHPDGWPHRRVGRILAAANAVSDEVVAVRRSAWSPAEHAGEPAPSRPPSSRRVPASGRAGVAAVAAVVIAVAATVAAGSHTGPSPPAPGVPRTVAEGRLVVEVPPGWTVTRVTAGPGSRRLQVTSPADPGIALHITQAYAPETTLGQAAELFAREIAAQPVGSFVGLRSDTRVFGRPAVVYREVRPGRFIDWTVILAGSTRISVGCQSKPGHEPAVAAGCEAAVRSARESGTDRGG